MPLVRCPGSVSWVILTPSGLSVAVHAPRPDASRGQGRGNDDPKGALTPAVILVHGSLDRGDSFRRVVRRLPELVTITYDRRGYQGSRDAGPTNLAGHIDDLIGLITSVRGPGGPAGCGAPVVVGHSLGGDVAMGAALERPDLVAAVGAFEPPLPWLGFRRQGGRPPLEGDPGDEAERFFRRMAGDHAWGRLTPSGQAARKADGPALLAELRSLHQDPPLELTRLSVPVVLGRGGAASAGHHRQGAAWLAQRLGDAELYEIPGAGHGAHLSHPDAFAGLVRRVVARGAGRQEATG